MDSQTSTTATSTGNQVSVVVRLGWFACPDKEFIEASVDVATAVKEYNRDDLSGYIHTVVNNILSPWDYINPGGTIHKNIIVAHSCIGVVCASISHN